MLLCMEGATVTWHSEEVIVKMHLTTANVILPSKAN